MNDSEILDIAWRILCKHIDGKKSCEGKVFPLNDSVFQVVSHKWLNGNDPLWLVGAYKSGLAVVMNNTDKHIPNPSFSDKVLESYLEQYNLKEEEAWVEDVWVLGETHRITLGSNIPDHNNVVLVVWRGQYANYETDPKS